MISTIIATTFATTYQLIIVRESMASGRRGRTIQYIQTSHRHCLLDAPLPAFAGTCFAGHDAPESRAVSISANSIALPLDAVDHHDHESDHEGKPDEQHEPGRKLRLERQ